MLVYWSSSFLGGWSKPLPAQGKKSLPVNLPTHKQIKKWSAELDREMHLLVDDAWSYYEGYVLNRTGSGTGGEKALQAGKAPSGENITISSQYPPEILDAAEKLLFLFHSGDSQAFTRVVKLLNSERDRVAKLAERATRTHQQAGDFELVKPKKSN